MATQNLKNLSKKDWITENSSTDDIKTSCLMRMADSLETMAKDKHNLECMLADETRKKEYWKNMYLTMERMNISYKGQITKLKNKLKSLNPPHPQNK